MTGGFDFASRIARARREMEMRSIDALLLSVGSDLPYLTGYEAMPLERLTMAVVPLEGDVTVVVPRLEAPRVAVDDGVFGLRAWDETENPVAIVASRLTGATRCAVGDQTWSRFLLGLQAALPGTRFVSASPVMSTLRLHKEPAEIDRLRAAGAAADRVAERLASVRFAGRTERQIAGIVSSMLVEEGHEMASFAIVASGPNGASPHHEAGDRVVVPGDPVVVDFGGRLGGYCSDTTRNFHVGEPGPAYRKAFGVLREAQQAGIAAAQPGTPAAEVDRVTRAVIEQAGFGEYFVHRTGHGIGLDVHEDPYIVEGNETPLAPGMAFSIEPGIYIPGTFGMRIEDIVVLTPSGPDRLNRSPRGVAIVD